MKKFVWRIEYSLTIFAIFAGILFMIPTSFTSKTAVFISRWNSEYNKIEYAFSALSAQAETEAIESFINSKNEYCFSAFSSEKFLSNFLCVSYI